MIPVKARIIARTVTSLGSVVALATVVGAGHKWW
jgi:hypothetical protein